MPLQRRVYTVAYNLVCGIPLSGGPALISVGELCCGAEITPYIHVQHKHIGVGISANPCGCVRVCVVGNAPSNHSPAVKGNTHRHVDLKGNENHESRMETGITNHERNAESRRGW